MGKIMKLSVVLFVITALTGLILGGVYTVTLDPIREAKEKEKMAAFAETLPGARDFTHIECKGDQSIIREINKGSSDGKTVGYNFTVTPKGYGGLIEMIVGIDAEGRLMDIKILSHTETPGLGAKAAEPSFTRQFHEKAVRKLLITKNEPVADDEVQAISGATISSSAVVVGVDAALDYWADNLNEEGKD
jgi:electron transport complex protein RnfG